MKKMIVLVGFVLVSVAAQAETILTPMLDFNTKDGWELILEISTPKFKSVTLDCQSFFQTMQFEEMSGKKHELRLDMYQCEEAIDFFYESKQENLPVCLGVDTDTNELLVTHDEEQDCK